MYPTIRDRKIRMAVVGCGRISKNHFGSIERHAGEIELAAVCDIDPATLEQHKERYRVPGYARLEDMLNNERLDLVALCTPSGLHAEQAIVAARHGVHVMTEKPMATRWQDGVRMVKACDEAGVRLFVVKQNRRNTTLQLLKRAVQEKRFGRIHLVHINVFWTRPQSYYDQAKWRGTWEFDGGAFMNQASHYVDLLDWLIGPVEKVQAMVSTTRDIEVEDTGVLNVKWRNGALGSMSVTMLTYPKNLEGSITILGEKGTVRVGGVAVNEIQIWDFAEPRDYDAQIQAASYETTSVYGFGHPLYYKNVIDVLRGEAEPETDGREGLKSLEVLIAAYLSARDGTMVSLPLEY
ncbi:Gfo/Idh/MocA family oxidoreductase [Tepidimonas taiwanensis]|uniref:Putative 4,5-dihydroxyphthalate dehydrogenase n=1 Tax=Tepidimonas taiwanensis TaxID=307486 RepID=A0A554X688_9BURK|nr:Gfo/Idh/MocA family oxidoreductase [Tepidimonas taiwanensis]TSE31348.1 putative 4,5-dihydroxyphthalate dehydrogenase [Tepidimonas taiwanensis]UBQ06135.1 Gfo/Idh/MocA family oxidoreductase [Tepidimonas taiwanensis]